MECINCKKEIKEEWNYCPFCSYVIHKSKDYSKMVDKYKNRIMKTPLVKVGGLCIQISQDEGNPEVKIKSLGNMSIEDTEEEKIENIKTQEFEIEKEIKEPHAEYKKLGKKTLIEISLPGIKEEKNLEILKLKQSLELKARTEDRMYFKIIKIPENSSIIKKELKNETLHLIIE